MIEGTDLSAIHLSIIQPLYFLSFSKKMLKILFINIVLVVSTGLLVRCHKFECVNDVTDDFDHYKTRIVDGIQEDVLFRDLIELTASKDNRTQLCYSLYFEDQEKHCDIIDICHHDRRQIHVQCSRREHD